MVWTSTTRQLLVASAGMLAVFGVPPLHGQNPTSNTPARLCLPEAALARTLQYERIAQQIPPSSDRRARVAWLRNHARSIVEAELSRLPPGSRLEFIRKPAGENPGVQRYRLVSRDGTELAFIDYFLKTPQQLHVLFVNNSSRGAQRLNGLTDVLLAQVIAANPGVTRITSTLADSNVNAVLRSIDAGIPARQALQTTPAYRARARLGFVELEVEAHTVTDLLLRRPSDVTEALREGHVMLDRFTTALPGE